MWWFFSTPSLVYLPATSVILISSLVLILHLYISRNFNYWEERKVVYVKPQPFFGNFFPVCAFRSSIGDFLTNLYNQTKDEPFFGIFVFDKPHLIVRSPHLIKSVLIKDFDNFDDRTVASPSHDLLISNLLFLNKNPEWKAVRVKMTPFFTSGKLKAMMPLMDDIGVALAKYLDKQISIVAAGGDNDASLEAKEICAKFSTDLIAKCAFGINAHSFDDPNAEFRAMGRQVFEFSWRNAISQTSFFFFSQFVNLLRLRFVEKRVTDYLRTVFWKTIDAREQVDATGNAANKKNDLIDGLIELRKDQQFCRKVDFQGDKVVAQPVQFFLAGFETTSSTMAFTLYELCIQPKYQNRLRDEILSNMKEFGGITYEAIQNMKYLDMCIAETLRKYPVLPFLDRTCKQDYRFPGSDVTIEKGTPVYIPLFGLHYDEQYFPHPQKYDPERFSKENVGKIVPFSYLPFGEGPRNCIGARFGALGAKLGVVHILSNFQVERSSETPFPIEFEPKSFILAAKKGLPMKFKKITTMAA